MPASEKVAFTASQWQELERQTVIYKYMMASVPVPPELLLPISKSPSHLPVSQSNTSGLNGLDSEPWRCRRTDGKKWRCSRDVAPSLKYCERHAHKSRPRIRSRKPVETQSHNNTTTHDRNNNNFTLMRPTDPCTQSFQKSISHFPTWVTAPSYDQSRCSDGFMNGGSIPLSSSSQQWQQLTQQSSREGLNRNNAYHDKHVVSAFQQHRDKLQDPMIMNSYITREMGIGRTMMMENQQLNDQLSASLGPKFGDTTQTTRHFIDAWSSAETRDPNEINKYSVSSNKQLPFSSLTLSMSSGHGTDNDEDDNHEGAKMGLGKRDLDGQSGGAIQKSKWLSPVSGRGSPPGGPLGEALCLGIAGTMKVASNRPSPHGYSYSYSTTTTTSSCSKSSCDDGAYGPWP